ncbi:MAG TPA: LysR substrate-binding domain-containing protein [Ramlibacter sp.]|uniref:LysR family transcriptional regulator n=1 Tax=Ramlibacter sp. TaxID=1917967 RepID=UPI002C65F3A1|nr:LysR substrate-binding domain-containing protein [Ramlibacter sp.]HVZ44003.1 LysR substrate-binding domain-containing protein [Ramlibacter sp.]
MAHTVTHTQEAGSLVDLPRLRRFLMVAEMGSLTRAAVMLDSTQSALSLQMGALERECGGRLFHRTGRGVTLTELGERLLPRARSLVRDADQLQQDMRSAAGIPHGDVVLGILPSTALTLVPHLLRKIAKHYPNIRLRVLEGSNGQIDEWLAQGRLDIALLYRYGRSKAPNEEALTEMDSWLVGKRGDALTRNPTVPFIRLDRLPLVLPNLPNGLRVTLDQQARRKNITLAIAVEVDSIPIQKELAIQGFGYGVLALHAVQRELEAGALQASRIVSPGIDRYVTLASTTRHPGTLAGRVVIKLLREAMSQNVLNPAMSAAKVA